MKISPIISIHNGSYMFSSIKNTTTNICCECLVCMHWMCMCVCVYVFHDVLRDNGYGVKITASLAVDGNEMHVYLSITWRCLCMAYRCWCCCFGRHLLAVGVDVFSPRRLPWLIFTYFSFDIQINSTTIHRKRSIWVFFFPFALLHQIEKQRTMEHTYNINSLSMVFAARCLHQYNRITSVCILIHWSHSKVLAVCARAVIYSLMVVFCGQQFSVKLMAVCLMIFCFNIMVFVFFSLSIGHPFSILYHPFYLCTYILRYILKFKNTLRSIK